MLRKKVKDAVLEGPFMRMERKHLTLQMEKLRLRDFLAELGLQSPPGGSTVPWLAGNMNFVQCNHLPLTVLAT